MEAETRSSKPCDCKAMDEINDVRLQAMDNTQDCICIVDKNKEVIYANKSFISVFGYKDYNELSHVRIENFFTEDQRDWLAKDVYLRLARKRSCWKGQTMGRRKDGSTFHQDISLASVNGQEIVFVSKDITELIKVKDTLRQRLAAIESTKDGICICNGEQRVNYFNNSLLKIHGISELQAGEFMNVEWLNLYDGETARKLKDKALSELERSGHWRGEAAIINHAGERVWIDLSLTALADGGFVATTRDISESKNSQHEREILREQFHKAQKIESIGRLTSGIAHDFNNIIASITGYSEFLIEDLEDMPAQRKFAENILDASEQAKQLIKQMLQLARKSNEGDEKILFSDIVKDTMHLISSGFPKSIEIKTVIKNSSAAIFVNRVQLARVLMNLCINSRDAMEGENGNLTIKFDVVTADKKALGDFVEDYASLDHDPSMVSVYEVSSERTVLELGKLIHGQVYSVMSVEDTGTGIERSTMLRLFEPFFTTKPINQGTGLGLSNIQNVVLSYAGALVVDSTVGKGTIFDIYIPSCEQLEDDDFNELDGDKISSLPSQTSSVASEESLRDIVKEIKGKILSKPKIKKPDFFSRFKSKHDAELKTNKQLRVLVVDDQEDVLDVITEMLDRMGHEGIPCSHAEEAIEIIREGDKDFDLIISDHNMPDISGIEFAYLMELEAPEIPILLITGYSNEQIQKEAEKYKNIMNILGKPIKRKELQSEINKIVQ